ncbi:hypothetical protein F5Y03DRAFT_137860 [Xylaria venustula]|nr:hypothetical protein F5Y03DRAFT_137860 [Xylaria venustula]
MPIDLDDLPRCSCGAVFLTDENLRCHTQENEKCISFFRELMRFASTQLAQFQIHSRTQDIDDIADDKPCRKHRDTEGRFHCPRWGCDFKATKPNHLLKHYGRYIPLYNEPPCVCCGKPAETIGQFLDHAKLHTSDNGDSVAKKEYLPKRCEELRKIRDGQLELETTKVKPTSGSASKKRKRKRTATSAAIDRDLPSSQPMSRMSSHHNAASSLDAIAVQCDPQRPSHIFTVHTEPGPHENRHPSPGRSAGISQLEGSTYEFQPPSENTNSRLQAAEYVESGISPLEPGPATIQDTRPQGNMFIMQPNAHVNARHVNMLPRLGNDSISSQDAGFDTNAAMNIMVQSVHPPPLQQQAIQYANLNMNNFIGPGTMYTDFSPVVSTLNFATQ